MANFSETPSPATLGTPAPDAPIADRGERRINVEHHLWTDDLLLGPDGRLRHAGHGSTGSYYQHDDVLHVRWDDYPADIFIQKGDKFVHVGPDQIGIVDMRRRVTAEMDMAQLPVAAVMLPIPGTGHEVAVRPGSSDVDVFRAIFLAKEYDRPHLDFTVRTVVDLGANVGMAAIFFALRHPAARIIAVEPERANFACLKRNTRAFPNITAVHAAIWHEDTTLNLRTTDAEGRALGDWGYQTEVQTNPDRHSVAAFSLRTLMRANGIETIDLLKVDVEGAELELFETAAETWLEAVRSIVVETHDRFRPGSDDIVTKALMKDFAEQPPSGENRIFIRRDPAAALPPRRVPDKHAFSIVTTARWETDSIVEWLLYHRSVGFDHVYLYCNDDDPAPLYEKVRPFAEGDAPFVTFRHFGLQGQQRQMLLHFLRTSRQETKWIAFLDVDEFLCMPGLDDIRAFMQTMPADTECVYFNWAFFGTSGFKSRPTGSVLGQYTRRQTTLHPLTKLLLQSDLITDAWIASNPLDSFWHDIRDIFGPIKSYNTIGEPALTYHHGFPDLARANLAGERSARLRDRACVFHYAIRSEEDFQRRFDRGIKGEFAEQGNWLNLVERGERDAFIDTTNQHLDTYLQEYWRRTHAPPARCMIVSVPALPNLALGKSALQSSDLRVVARPGRCQGCCPSREWQANRTLSVPYGSGRKSVVVGRSRTRRQDTGNPRVQSARHGDGPAVPLRSFQLP